MSEENMNDRLVWSCSLVRLPEEDELSRLEEPLRSGSLSFWDDAAALRRYIDSRHISQSACAGELGRSQASVANRLRLLKLPEDIRSRMRAASLTERHARALLRLEEKRMSAALDHILQMGLNVAETEAYVDGLCRDRGAEGVPAELAPLLAELERLRRSAAGIRFELEHGDGEIRLLIRLPEENSENSKK